MLVSGVAEIGAGTTGGGTTGADTTGAGTTTGGTTATATAGAALAGFSGGVDVAVPEVTPSLFRSLIFFSISAVRLAASFAARSLANCSSANWA